MRIKTSLLCGAAACVFAVGSLGGVAEAKTPKKPGATAAMQQQIEELREQVQFLKDRLDEQAAVSQKANADLKTTRASADAAQAQAAASAQTAQAAAAQIQTIPTVVKAQVAAIKPAPTWADSTSVSGRMYYNLSSIEQKSNGSRVPPSGVGFDVKRFYVGIDHKFNNTFSANVTTDFNYVSAISQTVVYIKKAYLQAKVSDALVIQAGATDMPWIPFMEGLYGNRYVEQTLDDRLKYGTSSDWGLHANGKFGPKGMFNYDVAVVDGAGYRAPVRSKQVDVEGRFNVNIDKFVVAVGGYTGKLGKDVVNLAAPGAVHTADRLNLAAAYVDPNFRLGAEWFQAHNWNNVTSLASDRSEGYSVFGTYYFAPKYAVFANYQWVQPNKTVNPALKDNYFNIGASYSPTKIVDIALVYKRDKAEHGSVSTGNGTIGGSRDGTYDEFGIFTQLRW
jgi:hypothetical protein